MTQATIFSVPTTGPATPDAMYGRIDDNFRAALSGHSGASRPTYAVAGTVWEDTAIAGSVKFYFYDGTDDILLYTVDTTNNRVFIAPQPYVDVASATTTDIGAITSGNVRITGTTTITGLGTAPPGTVRDVLFSGVLTVTHNATSLILQNGGSNILTAAGDAMRFVSLGSGNWRQTDWQRATPRSIHLGTGVSLSGTTSDWPVPPGARRVTVDYSGLGGSGTSVPIIQLGDSGGIETTGYSSVGANITASSAANPFTTGVPLTGSFASTTRIYGKVTMDLEAGNQWVGGGQSAWSNTTAISQVAGGKTLSAELTTVRLTFVNGTDTFTAGTANVSWEF